MSIRNSNKGNKDFYIIFIIIIIFLICIVGYLSYVIANLSKLQNSNENNNFANYATEDIPKNLISTIDKNTQIITHPELNYQIKIPVSWKPKLFTSPIGYAHQPFQDLIVYNPTYNPNTEGSYSIEKQKNASILIRSTESTYTNIEQKFKDNLAAQKIARNIMKKNIRDLEYIQYDYSFQGENATIAIFLRDGLSYYVKFQYDNEEIKRQNDKVFQDLIQSFQLQTNTNL